MATITLEEAKSKIKIEKSEVYPYGIIDNVDEVLEQIFMEFNQEIEKIEENLYNLRVESGNI